LGEGQKGRATDSLGEGGKQGKDCCGLIYLKKGRERFRKNGRCLLINSVKSPSAGGGEKKNGYQANARKK